MERMYKDYKIFKKYLNSLSLTFIGWLVGFWEGEGYIEKHKNTNYNYVFTIAQKDPSPLEFIKEKLKIGTVRGVGMGKLKTYRYDLYSSGKILALLDYFTKLMRSNKRINQVKNIYKNLNTIKKHD